MSLRSAFLASFRRISDAIVTTPIRREVENSRLLTGRLLVEQVRRIEPDAGLRRAEFRVFSQFGEDGIIQFLIHHADVGERTFVEFGVEDYTESNTRFLLMNDNWRGLVIDGSERNIGAIRRRDLYWRHTLEARAHFITRENIDGLIAGAGFRGDIGLLSIDLDGNDYWVWDRIDSVKPVIVVAEYNSVFGPDAAVTVPYDAAFVRSRAHHSHLYFGASLQALCQLGRRKGYTFVGCNTAGNNAFFVRDDRLGSLPAADPKRGFVAASFREGRGETGELTFADAPAQLATIAHLPVHDVEHDDVAPLERVLARRA